MEYKYSVKLVISLILLAKFILLVSSSQVSKEDTATRHKKRSAAKKGKEEADKKAGTYKTKEEVEKPPKMDHPCNLTRTTVRISFPELKGEVFVNLLGYKEPNLIPLWRCKGVCGDVDSPIACSATKVKQKKVLMTVKTHLYGRDSKERLKELILDEHEECSCQCSDLSASLCAGTFNEKTCECHCEEAKFGSEKAACEGLSSNYWDQRTCQCRSKSVAPRETDAMMSNCLEDFSKLHHSSGFDVIGYIFLGSCITMAAILTATTLYYRRKLKKLASSSQARNNKSRASGDTDYSKKKKKES